MLVTNWLKISTIIIGKNNKNDYLNWIKVPAKIAFEIMAKFLCARCILHQADPDEDTRLTKSFATERGTFVGELSISDGKSGSGTQIIRLCVVWCFPTVFAPRRERPPRPPDPRFIGKTTTTGGAKADNDPANGRFLVRCGRAAIEQHRDRYSLLSPPDGCWYVRNSVPLSYSRAPYLSCTSSEKHFFFSFFLLIMTVVAMILHKKRKLSNSAFTIILFLMQKMALKMYCSNCGLFSDHEDNAFGRYKRKFY